MLNLDVIDKIKEAVDNLGHSIVTHKLLGKFENRDLLVSDVLLKPDGITGAFFYTLNIVCMELHPPINFCPISINLNPEKFDCMEAKATPPIEEAIYGIDILDDAQITALVYATIDRLFEAIPTEDRESIKGAVYRGCEVFTEGTNSILPASPEAIIAHRLSAHMGKPSRDFQRVETLIDKLSMTA